MTCLKEEYPDWLKKQPESFKRDVLGNKYQAFESGEYEPDRYQDNGETLTLEQLKELDQFN